MFIKLNETFNLFVRELTTFLENRFAEDGVIIPIPNLTARAKFWRAIIVFISNLYQVSGSLVRTANYDMIFDYPASIGDEVTILTINREGMSNFITF